jgi:adenylate cyclase
LLFRRFGFTPWEKNPRICRRCFEGIETHAKACPSALEDGLVAGSEVELSMLFADVRGSSKLARQMPVLDFTNLMSRFYRVSSEVLFEADAIIEKFVGDEVVGLFLPFLAGREHAQRWRRPSCSRMPPATTRSGPWPRSAPSTPARRSSGSCSRRRQEDFTALGDAVNIAVYPHRRR